MVETISILQDGNCLFRSIASSINNDLFNAKRYVSGRIIDNKFLIIEKELSKSLRFLVINYLIRNKQRYINEKIGGCSKFLDVKETFHKHLSRMKNDGEFGEFLEITGISDMLNVNINIYMKKEDEPYLIFSTSNGKENIHLLLVDNHYDILKRSPKKKNDINLNPKLRRSVRIRELNKINKF